MHGVHRSGGDPLLHIYKREPYIRDRCLDRKAMSVEAGGITVYRPLLSFPKESLIATCQLNGVEWAEDLSNRDPTVTIRNAARNLIISQSLPKALQQPSLLGLAERAGVRVQKRMLAANRLSHATKIQLLDLRSGHLRIEIPDLCEAGYDPTSLHIPSEERQFELGLYLRELIRLVTSAHTVATSVTKNAVEHIFGDCESSPKVLTIGTVLIRRVMLESSRVSTMEELALLQKGQAVRRVWSLSRQPYNWNEQIPVIPVQSSRELLAKIPYELWDGRFWIRVQNLTSQSMCIRPFRKNDLKYFMEGFPSARKTPFVKILKSAAPGNMKWTLPAIALVDAHGMTSDESLVALPSLGAVLPQWQDKVKWNVKYKSIEAWH
jgi:tRNA(Ile)-lysidine synthase